MPDKPGSGISVGGTIPEPSPSASATICPRPLATRAHRSGSSAPATPAPTVSSSDAPRRSGTRPGIVRACHTLTTQITGHASPPDAVAQEPWISNPTLGAALELEDEKMKYAHVADHRTDWALRSGAGKIHPWMVPGHGNELAALPPGISSADWRQLSDCLWDAGGAECGYQPLYTLCPAPQLGAGGDGSEPTDAAVAVLPLPAGETGADRVLRVSWRYLNQLRQRSPEGRRPIQCGSQGDRDSVDRRSSGRGRLSEYGGNEGQEVHPYLRRDRSFRFRQADPKCFVSGTREVDRADGLDRPA